MLLTNSWLHNSFLLLVAILIITPGLAKPFIGIGDDQSITWVFQAQTLFKQGFGLSEVVFLNDQNNGWKVLFNPHSFSLTSLITAVSFSLLGVTETAARIIPLVFSLLTLIGIYHFGRIVIDKVTGLLAGALVLVTPGFLYFCKQPGVETLVLCLSVWLGVCYVNWLKTQSNKQFLCLGVLTLVSGFVSWAGYCYVLALLVHAFLFYRQRIGMLLILPLTLITAFFTYLSTYLFLTGHTLFDGYWQVLLQGTSANNGNGDTFTWFTAIANQFSYIEATYSQILLLTAGVWALLTFRQWWKRDYITRSEQDMLTLLLLPLSFSVLFPELVWMRQATSIFWLPFIVISAATVLRLFIQALQFTKLHALILTASLVVGIGYHNLPAYQTFQQSSQFKDGLVLGKIINSETQPGKKVLIHDQPTDSGIQAITNFYAQREIAFATYSLSVWKHQYEPIQKEYTYLILDPKNAPDASLSAYFQQKLPLKRAGMFMLLKLQ